MARALYVRRDGLLLRYYLSQYNNGSEKDTTYFPKWHLSIILPPRRHSLPKECWGDTVKDVMQIAGPWWDDLRREIPKLEVASDEFCAIQRERVRQEKNAHERNARDAHKNLVRAYLDKY